jgi:secreted Zn-dependent insulinase-like peptidase
VLQFQVCVYTLTEPAFFLPSFFIVGNLETLLTTPTKAGIDVRAAVADWHSRHYSANLMTAAVYGRHSLDELQQLVTDAFAGVTNTGLQAPQFPADLYTDKVR